MYLLNEKNACYLTCLIDGLYPVIYLTSEELFKAKPTVLLVFIGNSLTMCFTASIIWFSSVDAFKEGNLFMPKSKVWYVTVFETTKCLLQLDSVLSSSLG